MYLHPEGGALILPAVEGDLTAHFVHQFLRNHQAKTGTAVTARNTGIRLTKGLEQLRLLLLRDTDAGIVHLNLQFRPRDC